LSDNVSVLLNNGLGVFNAAVNFPAGSNPRSMVNADFNADGKSDLAVVNMNSSDITFLTGDGAGGFSANAPVATDSFPNSITSADFNGDGLPDLAVTTEYTNQDTGNINIFLNCFQTGIDQIANENPFTISNNPGSGTFTIHSDMKNLTSASIQIYDIDGRMVYRSDLLNPVVDLTGSGAGIYVARIGIHEREYFSKLIVK
jgi:hypothetical protein